MHPKDRVKQEEARVAKVSEELEQAQADYAGAVRLAYVKPLCDRYGLRFYSGMGIFFFGRQGCIVMSLSAHVGHSYMVSWPVALWPDGLDDADEWQPEGWQEAAAPVWEILCRDMPGAADNMIGDYVADYWFDGER